MMRQVMMKQVMKRAGTPANTTDAKAWATPLAIAALTLAIIAAGAGLRAIQSAEAASPAAVAPAGYGTLSPAPGLRLARIDGGDGLICFRASRAISGEDRTTDKTFCQH